MGIKKTVLPWIVLTMGLTGLSLACFMQWYVNSPHTQFAGLYILSGYPLRISGKPFWSLPPNIPVMFELTVLILGADDIFRAVGALQLPRFHHPVFNVARFRRVTDDKFFILIEAADGRFDRAGSRALLESTHPTAIEEVKD